MLLKIYIITTLFSLITCELNARQMKNELVKIYTKPVYKKLTSMDENDSSKVAGYLILLTPILNIFVALFLSFKYGDFKRGAKQNLDNKLSKLNNE